MPLLGAHHSVTVYVTALSVSPSLRWHSAQLRPCVFGPRSVSHALSFSAAVGVALRVVFADGPHFVLWWLKKKCICVVVVVVAPVRFVSVCVFFLFGVWICADLVRLAQFIYNIQRLRSACANRVDSTRTRLLHITIADSSPLPMLQPNPPPLQ